MNKKLAAVMLSVFLAETAPVTLNGEEVKTPRTSAMATETILYTLADEITKLLLCTRNVIALNQDLINTCSAGHYEFKGFVPAVVASQISEDFGALGEIALKQTSLKTRNPDNTPDDWETETLKKLDSPGYSKGKAFAEMVTVKGKATYRYMRPIYITPVCLPCHGEKESIPKEIREFLESRYPQDAATGYKTGDLRGGISVTIPVADWFLDKLDAH
ncbi:MAG TPA: Tll0287-like domain-containing protein [Candidatus Avalokitesvara rifleensis]|uniref:Tll0287-like domain-containing protein n=1 Tax=Candidatus Avalokitesvara rifleensis TaxID=3367620 RepID=UPI0027139FFA|nr:DUF3365 domain-containing protein [Candidatus Brocadiales bacterium]